MMQRQSDVDRELSIVNSRLELLEAAGGRGEDAGAAYASNTSTAAHRKDGDDTSEETIQREMARIKEDNRQLKTINQKSSANVGFLDDKMATLESEFAKAKIDLAKSNAIRTLQDNEIQRIQALVARDRETRAKATATLQAEETARRHQHNDAVERKGNFSVYDRVRPFIDNEETSANAVIAVTDAKTIVADRITRTAQNAKKLVKTRFVFDKVFSAASTQADIYGEISELIQSSMDGFNVYILAYGVSGSGKTFSIQGAIGEKRGLIARIFEDLFHKSTRSTYTFELSVVEIYNEMAYDLLRDTVKFKLEIRLDEQTKEFDVPGLTTKIVNNVDEVAALLQLTANNRTVASTSKN